MGNGGSNAKLGQVAIVVEGTVAAVTHYITREPAHSLSVTPQQLLQQLLVGRGARSHHRRSNDAGWMIVYGHVSLVGEVQAKGGVVDDAGFWVGATAGPLIDRRAFGGGWSVF
jgi:hypothetical protein